MPTPRYGNARLGRLLRLLRPAPEGWVTRAKLIVFEQSVHGQLGSEDSRLTDVQLAELRRALVADPVFRSRFDADPVAAAEEAGLHDLATALEHELSSLVSLAERIAADAGFRADLDRDPEAALADVGFPVATAESFLRALDVSGEVLDRLPEVVAHRHGEPSLTAGLVDALLGSNAVVEKLREASRVD
ncbi:MAG: hypothetical protein C5B48_13790 [Candidatus Rokuibacteriota bacterium]|nr:MAG: hypothetical protein C5B48_13790 [Candidatus Rokubacteria bacterium]